MFVSEKTPTAKLSQILSYGAKVIAVKGSYSDAFKMAKLASQQYKWFNVTSTFLNPYTTEGDKTVAYELHSQLEKVFPDCVFIVHPNRGRSTLSGNIQGLQ